jgi:hypothetical protein
MDRLRLFAAYLYIHIAGVRFYSTESFPVEKDIRQFIVRTLHGYEIKFTFYREKLNFTKYVFKRLKKCESTIYVISAQFDERAPEVVRRYNSVRIFVRPSFTCFLSETTIIKVLLNVYLDYLLNELIDWENTARIIHGTRSND